MYHGKLVFAQAIDHLPHHTLRRCIQRYHGNYHIKRFSCQDQYRCMAFAQLTYRESLRDIEACLRAHSNKLYHMGLRSTVSRSTLADANEQRDWRIYAASTSTTTSASNSTTRSMHSTPRPSTCVCPCFPGRTFVAPKAR